MNLINANPLTQTFHYLSRLIYGTPYENLETTFIQEDKKYAQFTQDEDVVYDFIIVGGGSAGSVVASRLSEENYNVLLLEAGGNPFPLTSVPALTYLNVNHPSSDWKDTIQPQARACHSFKNNAGIFNRGKVLGGGSTINAMICMRGNAQDYNRWAEEVGDESWSYENMLPYLKKLETYDGAFPSDELHGTSGPIHVSKNPCSPFREEWLQAGKDMGYQVIDPNGHQTASFFPYETTTTGGTRFSANRGYLYPCMTRPNLHIRLYCTVNKIHLDEENRAVGVEFENEGQTHFVKASKEIIVSSGAVGSPKLLMLSGIGPRKHLESLGIKVKVDLPAVGQNLQDHQMIYLGPFTIDETKVQNPAMDADVAALHQYILNGTGPFSSAGGAGGALFQSSVSPGWPDIFMTTFQTKLDTEFGDLLEFAKDFKEGTLRKYFEKEIDKHVLFVVVSLGLPKSRGEIKLTNKDPAAPLHIDPNYFQHEDDAKAVLESIKFVLDMVKNSETMKKVGAKLTDTLLPGCEHFKNNEDDEYWKCYYKHWSSTMWHYTCTNRMGKSKENSVVDNNLRVWGTKGLRIVDASVFPYVTNTNTNIPTLSVGEKASDLIKNSWSHQ